MRRVVIGVGDDGRSTALSDGPPPGIWDINYRADPSLKSRPPLTALPEFPAELAEGQFVKCDLWATFQTPPDPNAPDPGADPAGPAAGGPGQTRWLISAMGPNLYWPPHATNTVNYGVVLRGSTDLILENGVVPLGPGDCVVNTGGKAHGWRAGPEGCILVTTTIGL